MNLSPIAFHQSICNLHRCSDCYQGNKEEYFMHPVGLGFVPFRIVLDGTFEPFQGIDFFDKTTAVDDEGCTFSGAPTADYSITADIEYEQCDGKTYIWWNGYETRSFSFTWDDSVLTYGQTGTSNNLPTGVHKICINVSGAGYKSIRIAGADAQTLYEGTDEGEMCFEGIEITGTSQLVVEYVDQGADPVPLDSVDINSATLYGQDFLEDCFEGIARIELVGVGHIFSEVFKAYGNIDCFPKITYETPCDDCVEKFTGWFWLTEKSKVAMPDYEVETYGDNDDQDNLIVEKRVLKESVSIIIANCPDYLVTFLYYLSLCSVSVETTKNEYQVISWELEHSYYDQKCCIANVRGRAYTEEIVANYCC